MPRSTSSVPSRRSSLSSVNEIVPALEYSDGSSSGTDDQEEEQVDKSIAKGGVSTPFPWKLHDMLDDMDKNGDPTIVCWQPHGRAFMVLKPKEFVEKIMHHYFNQTKYASFQRQLNLYGFSRLSHGRDKGAYFHKFFVRGERNLCRGMIRQKIKGTKVRRSLSPEEEPNFYSPQWEGRNTIVQPPLTITPSRPMATTSNKAPKKQGVRANPNGPSMKLKHPNAARSAQQVPSKPTGLPRPAGQAAASLYSLVRETSRSTTAPAAPFLPPPPVLVQSLHPRPPPAGPPQAHIMPLPTLIPATKHGQPPVSRGPARGGDVLFFEGRPFRYLEHLEELPPPPSQPISRQEQLRQQQQSYKDSLTDIINSIVHLDPKQRLPEPQNLCPV